MADCDFAAALKVASQPSVTPRYVAPNAKRLREVTRKPFVDFVMASSERLIALARCEAWSREASFNTLFS